MAEAMENVMSTMKEDETDDGPTEEDDTLINISKTALQRTYAKGAELLEPDHVLNLFMEKDLFGDSTKMTVRDMREQKTTTAKNNAIYDKISREPTTYREFKRCLAKTRQLVLLDALEKKEEEVHKEMKANGHQCIGETTGTCEVMTSLKCQRDIPEYMPSIVRSTQKFLVDLYNEQYQKVPIYPLRPEWTENVVDLYVKQHMVEMNPRGVRVDQACTEATLADIRNVFYSGQKSHKNIYLVAESGSGKSTLCQYLVYLWVKEHSKMESEGARSGDDSFIEKFSLLFYLSLREANGSKTSNVEDMIRYQLDLNLNDEDMSMLILDYPCLIILDGLDEYSLEHSKSTRSISARLPWRRQSDKCTFLTTSRPWKMELLSSELGVKIDRQIRITGLETNSQKDLAKIVITKLNSIKEGANKNFTDFIDDMEKRHLEKYMETPILLLQMLGLWFDGESFGKSQCEIYSKIIDKQIEFALEIKNISEASNEEEPRSSQPEQKKVGFQFKLFRLTPRKLFGKRLAEASGKEENQLPSLLSSMQYCQKFQGLLLKLSNLAYHHLFGSQESALIFDHDQMEMMGLSKGEINTCLQLGLLTQYNVLDKIAQRQKSISFVHKSHQEFFAAIYLWQTGLGSDLKQLLTSFTDLDGVLQIEKSLNFISGMNTKVACEIAKVIMSLASQDARIQQYMETSLAEGAPNEALVQQIQGVILAAIEESRNNGLEIPAIPIQDLWIKDGHRNFSPSRILAFAESLKLSYVKSIIINTPSDIPRDVIQRWVQTPTQLNKLVLYNCDISAACVVDIVKRNRASLQTLGLYNDDDYLDLCRLSQRDLTMILSPTSLALQTVVMSHEQLELICTHLARRPHTEVMLSGLCCQRHGYDGCTPRLDLSTSTELRRLRLLYLPLQDVTYEPRRLLQCEIGSLPDTVAVHALQHLTEARNLETLICHNLTKTALVELVRILPQLNTLTLIALDGMDLRGQQPIVLHNTTALETIQLWDITLTPFQLPKLLADLPSHSVWVALGYTDLKSPVTITNYDPKYNLIQHISDSPHTEVTNEPEVSYQDDKCVVKVFHFYHEQ